MIAKLERTPRTEKQNKDQTQKTPKALVAAINNESTTIEPPSESTFKPLGWGA